MAPFQELHSHTTYFISRLLKFFNTIIKIDQIPTEWKKKKKKFSHYEQKEIKYWKPQMNKSVQNLLQDLQQINKQEIITTQWKILT
jgi:hypothetical protein